MKCPKCGEDLDTGLNCYKCGYLDTKKIELEPTIAEKLLWLVENKPIHMFVRIESFSDWGMITYCDRETGKYIKSFDWGTVSKISKSEAINEAYKFGCEVINDK